MNNDKYVAAVEISSSKIIAAVGRMRSDGRLNIIATEQVKGVESVRYGIIQNLEETAMRIVSVLDKLQREPAVAPRTITGLYVGLSGRSLRSISTEVDINLPDDTEITQQHLQQLRERALANAIDASLEVVDAIPRTYVVDRMQTMSPKGVVGNHIHATFDLIVCRPELRRNLTRTISDKVGISINGFVVTALATAQVILSSEEKRLGCMLVDMGAETTTVSVYKDGALRYFATLPLGGRNITRDITSVGWLEERAEEIKLSYGNAIARDNASSQNLYGVKMSDVSNLIVARSEEIVANIVEQLKYAGLKDTDMPGGLVCIGGGANLNGMIDLLSRQTSLPVRRGQLPAYIHIEQANVPTSEVVQVSSVLYTGASGSDQECLAMPGAQELPVTGTGNDETETNERRIVEPEPKKTGNGWIGRIARGIAGIFEGSDEDDSDLIE